MKRCVWVFVAILALGVGARSANSATDESCLWGAPGGRTTYLPPYNPSDAPTIPLLKRSEVASDRGAGNGAGKKNGESSGGPRVGDSGTFVGADGKTYYYRFVEGARRRTVVETRPDASSPNGLRKTLRYVDEPRLIKQIWPAETLTAPPEPCRPVENVAETENVATASASASVPATYRASVRVIVP